MGIEFFKVSDQLSSDNNLHGNSINGSDIINLATATTFFRAQNGWVNIIILFMKQEMNAKGLNIKDYYAFLYLLNAFCNHEVYFTQSNSNQQFKEKLNSEIQLSIFDKKECLQHLHRFLTEIGWRYTGFSRMIEHLSLLDPDLALFEDIILRQSVNIM